MNIQLKIGHTMCVVGPSGAGKTALITRLLLNKRWVFDSMPGKIWWLYNEDIESGMTGADMKKLTNIEFVKGFQEGWLDQAAANDIIVIDDLFTEAAKQDDLTNLFTRSARHRNLFVIFLTQNLFFKNSRSRNINTHYLIIFSNPRDCLLIQNLSRQIYGRGTFLSDAYRDATENKPHGYLFIDFTQECPSELRVRANLFNPPIIVYKPIK